MQIHALAALVRTACPALWRLGGGEHGTVAYRQWSKLITRGQLMPADASFVKKWDGRTRKLRASYTVKGLVACLKWHVLPDMAPAEVLALLNDWRAEKAAAVPLFTWPAASDPSPLSRPRR